MQSRVSSSFAVLTSLFLLSASDLVVAQISAPVCTSSLWQWSYNSLNQNPCTVAAYLLGTCDGGVFTLGPILNTTYSYSGTTEAEAANLCLCNTVVYNLLSACSVCQEGSLRSWSLFSYNCTRTLDPSTFPNPVPPQIRVPQWALQDITLVNLWNATRALSIGDTPEIFPGQLIGTSTSSSDSPTTPTTSASSSVVASSSPVPTSSGSASNAGAIAGGVVGGIIAIAAVATLVLSFRRRRQRTRTSRQAPSAAFIAEDPSPPPSGSRMSQVHSSSSYDRMPGPQMTLYDPNNPATYPRHEGVPTSTPDVNVPLMPYNGYNGNNHANLQPSRPRGYSGLPTV